MTRRTNARIAGLTFLLYIVVGIASLALKGRPHTTELLTMLMSFSALVLGVTLYAITREVDRDVALLAMLCRVVEAIPKRDSSAIYFAVGSTLFSWLLLRGRIIPAALAWLGVIGSLLMVVILPLQGAGVLAGSSWSSSVTWLMWLPLLVFEIALAVWFLTKGASPAQ
jgi:uncharacterized protein DUF4386